jgi:SAM-dependent methyltransferase
MFSGFKILERAIMAKAEKIDSKEVGLEIGLIIGNQLFNTEHLHYGYWTEGLPVNLMNLPKAQQNYSDFIIEQIPPSVKTILDVGCGVGKFARQLQEKGYEVDCVSPSAVFSERARALLGDKSQIFESKFEELETDKRYDLILFSESFQYIPIPKAFEKSNKLMNKPGYILICDFFETGAEGESVMGGGHKLDDFYYYIKQQSYENLKNMDITPNTAPTLDVVDQVLSNVGKPVWELVIQYLESNYRLISKFLKWKFKKKIAKINRKYFSGARNGENFSIFKSYRLLLFRAA